MKGGVIVTGIGLVVTTVLAPVFILVGTFAGLAVASVVSGPMVSETVFDQANGIPSEYLGEPVTVPVKVDATIEVDPGTPDAAEPAEPAPKVDRAKKSESSASRTSSRSRSSRSSSARSSSSRSSSSSGSRSSRNTPIKTDDLFADDPTPSAPDLSLEAEEDMDEELNIDDALEGFDIQMLDEEEDTKKKKKKRK